MISELRDPFGPSMHPTGRGFRTIFVAAVNTLTTIRKSLQKNRHVYALAVVLLAFGVASQAVRAKHCDYVPRTAQSVRFSTTVKIADLAHHVVVGPEVVSVFHGVHPIVMDLRITDAPCESEFATPRLSEQISFRQLRAPPISF
jgi:hypothetical protein